MEEPLGMAEVAARAGLSGRHLERIFKQETGKSPKRFYLDLRLERAERLINYSEMSMRDVALATGFSSLALFSRGFKARYGKPPSGLRG
jgi:AraC family transcriptional regulator, carnitine catabolism transcriptional activator